MTEYFFAGKPNATLDSDTQSVTLYHDSKLFTGWNPTGGDFSRKFSMTDKSVSKASRHTITGTLARNILFMIRQNRTQLHGDVVFKGDKEQQGRMTLYKITIKQKRSWLNDNVYYVLADMDAHKAVLDDAECRRIIDLPVLAWKAGGRSYGDIGKATLLSFYDSEIDELVDLSKYIDLTASKHSESARADRTYKITDDTAKNRIGTADQQL